MLPLASGARSASGAAPESLPLSRRASALQPAGAGAPPARRPSPAEPPGLISNLYIRALRSQALGLPRPSAAAPAPSRPPLPAAKTRPSSSLASRRDEAPALPWRVEKVTSQGDVGNSRTRSRGGGGHVPRLSESPQTCGGEGAFKGREAGGPPPADRFLGRPRALPGL